MKYLKKAIPNLIVLIFGASFTFSGYLLTENRKLEKDNQYLSEGIREVENTYRDIRGCKLSTPTQGKLYPPMQVVFKDGVLNYVNWSYLQEPRDNFEELVSKNYHSVETSLDNFQSHVTESSLSILESYSSHEARVKRSEISKLIITNINNQGHPLYLKDYTLLGFCVPSSKSKHKT